LDAYYLKDFSMLRQESDHPSMGKFKQSPNQSLLFENGIRFEDQIMRQLKEDYGDDMQTINDSGHHGITREKYQQTIDCMMRGVPIIAQACLYNDLNKTRGTADLLIRSDYINRLYDRQVLQSIDETLSAPLLKGNYHYLVIDVKWTTMTLCADGSRIRNAEIY
jgi:hypothetical protein